MEEYVFFFFGGGVWGKNMQKYLISVFGRRERIFQNLYSAIWAEMKLLELDSFVQKSRLSKYPQMLRLAC